ncbi:hypothetical protein [Ruegeria arenilitoris]|uniref:hypothetical protein n=1 Tax=Ruegeria arenilitoris TaxID=1173585 RepID=UPI00147A59A8|nr:hypothetical protein [Ruegeria arenilitoris]
MSDQIRSDANIDLDSFARFLKVWQLARTVKTDNRGPVLDGLAELTKKYSTRVNVADGDFVSELEAFRKIRGTTGKPCSMVSKFLFCANPLEFSPYDQYARRALSALGAKIGIADYSAFLEAFESFHAVVRQEMNNTLSREDFAYEDVVFESDELFSRRVTDKYLMLLGGFGDGRMVEAINKVKSKFPESTLKNHVCVFEARN